MTATLAPSRQPLIPVPAVNGPFFIGVGLLAGAIIAYQLAIMRIFSVASWAHFGSLVVSIAMLGFGVASAVMCVGKGHFERQAGAWARAALWLFGPLMVVGNLLGQQAQFNPIFLLADSAQQYLLFANFASYFLPFLAGALFLGVAFLVGRERFQLTYGSDMTGSGLAGLACLGAMYVLAPDRLLLAPLILWLAGAAVWFAAAGDRRGLLGLAAAAVVAFGLLFALPQIEVSPYKGVSYAKKFPDSDRIYQATGAHGFTEVYTSSYFHFAPGLSDMAAVDLPELPVDAYLGMYQDSDGPIGLMKTIEKRQEDYYRYLPMMLPYVLKKSPDAFVVQFGGGISTRVALAAGAKSVQVAEDNPMVLDAFANPRIKDLTGDMLKDPRLSVVRIEGRLHLAGQRDRYDVVDLSLADSTGLSSPGGFAVTEKYGYTLESMRNFIQALKPEGVLAITLWNKEDPPKSVLRLFTTLVAAAREQGVEKVADSLYVTHTFLSTVTLLYKRGGFTQEEVARLDDHCRRMAFETVYRPGERWQGDGEAVFEGYRRLVLGAPEGEPVPAGGGAQAQDAAGEPSAEEVQPDLSATNLYRLALDRMVHEGPNALQGRYPFDTAPLTSDRPYFAGSIHWKDLPNFLGRLETISDEWGYLLLWATLFQALLFGLLLLSMPVLFGWRAVFSRQRGKLGLLAYFFCLGLGYIMVEVTLIGKFINALGNPTVSTGVLITGMLICTGLGSLWSSRFLDQCRRLMPWVFIAIAAMLAVYGQILDQLLPTIGTWPYGARVLACLLLLVPPSFLMGFPFATGMAMLARLGKDHFFLWAWGINGMFSVVGAVLVPLVAVSYGLSTNLMIAAALYLLAWPCFFALLQPAPGAAEPCGIGQPAPVPTGA